MSTHNYSPGQNVEALRNGQWVPAHIMNPNPDGTYYIIINGTIPEYLSPLAADKSSFKLFVAASSDTGATKVSNIEPSRQL